VDTGGNAAVETATCQHKTNEQKSEINIPYLNQ